MSKNKVHKKDYINAIRKYMSNHPVMERILDRIYVWGDKISRAYFIMGVLVLGGVLFLLYIALPEEITKWLSPVIGVTFSVVIAPIILSMYGRKKDVVTKRFESNYELYKEILDVLVMMVVDRGHLELYIDKYERIIQSNFAQMYLRFDSELFYDLMSLHNNCQNWNYDNIKYYAEKCIRKMRKEGECGGWITISRDMINILEKKNRR